MKLTNLIFEVRLKIIRKRKNKRFLKGKIIDMKMDMMQLHWGYGVVFLLEGLKSGVDSKGLYFLGLLVSLVLGFLSQFCRQKKRSLAKGDVSKSTILILEVVKCIADCLNMLLLMTFNWGVILSIVLGQIAGFFSGVLERYEVGADFDDESKATFSRRGRTTKNLIPSRMPTEIHGEAK